MKALKGRVALERKCETAIMQLPVRESKSYGAMEARIVSRKGQYRTLKLYLEHRIQYKVPFGHPLDGSAFGQLRLHSSIDPGTGGQPTNL